MTVPNDRLLHTPAAHTHDGLLESLHPYRYQWPTTSLSDDARWKLDPATGMHFRGMPESDSELAADSRWPALFPSPICVITASDGTRTAMEREVGASIVNRFPYVVAVSICRTALSERHHRRTTFMDILESGKVASLQFLPPGPRLDSALDVIASIPDERTSQRITASGLPTRSGITSQAPVLEDAYLVYEAALVRPQRDFGGNSIYECPWLDVGSHRVYFLEIKAIQLREDIAMGATQIRWRALPTWDAGEARSAAPSGARASNGRYQKGYDPNYTFPAANTIAFEHDDIKDGMAIKLLPPLPEDQVEVDNDRARWPCFFPSSCGLITTYDNRGTPNVMPCGSTTVISRNPFVIAPCVSYTNINERYAARRSLDLIRERGRFGCSVPYIGDTIVDAIKYCGNNSLSDDENKALNSGLTLASSEYGPLVKDAPVHFDCEVVGEVMLGTHILFLGRVAGIHVHPDVTPENPLNWCPWPGITDPSSNH